MPARPGSATSVSAECRTCPPILRSQKRTRLGGSTTYCVRRSAFFPTKPATDLKRRCPSKTSCGLFSGEAVTREMFEECQLVNSIYGDIASRLSCGRTKSNSNLRTPAAWGSDKGSEDKEKRKSAVPVLVNKAAGSLPVGTRTGIARDQFSSLHLFVHYWAQGKQENRRAWAQAMNTVVTGGSGSGAVLYES